MRSFPRLDLVDHGVALLMGVSATLMLLLAVNVSVVSSEIATRRDAPVVIDLRAWVPQVQAVEPAAPPLAEGGPAITAPGSIAPPAPVSTPQAKPKTKAKPKAKSPPAAAPVAAAPSVGAAVSALAVAPTPAQSFSPADGAEGEGDTGGEGAGVGVGEGSGVGGAPAAPVPVPLYQLTALPRLVKRPPLQYPEPMRVLGEESTVKLDALIDEKGQVRRVEIVESGGVAFDEAASAAIMAAQFAPGEVDGKPVAVIFRIPVRFSLR